VKDVVFLGYQDGEVEPTIALRRDLTRVIRRVKPHVVVCGDPTMRWYGSNYLNHPDHRAVASAALDAVFPSSETRVIFQELLAEGLEPHKVKELFISGALHRYHRHDRDQVPGAPCARLAGGQGRVGRQAPARVGVGGRQGGRREARRGVQAHGALAGGQLAGSHLFHAPRAAEIVKGWIMNESKRRFINRSAGLLASGLVVGGARRVAAGEPPEIPPSMKVPGAGMGEYGSPAKYESKVTRTFIRSQPGTTGSGASRAPLESLEGMITPSGLQVAKRLNPREYSRGIGRGSPRA